MTTYMQSLTLPTAVFQHSATSVLLPIALGTAVGYSTRRPFLPSYKNHDQPASNKPRRSRPNEKDIQGHEAASTASACLRLRTGLDATLRHHGLRRAPSRRGRPLAAGLARDGRHHQAHADRVHDPARPQPGVDAALLRRPPPR
ncbi:hypothetical protein NLG97_g11189 [Lecanicillium saksenae]|uniref:Uncharacterized protein n=1 Tax=Lecanicillium saksenae TaxID=468837 RepID=A0ACC1QEX9_9HYPO|nr:hypothetical protein NLG97_g11189 [Lecanicillium saksenae]